MSGELKTSERISEKSEDTNTNKTINVLLIEDNIGDARLVSEYLSEEKRIIFNISFVDSLAKGIIVMNHRNFDVILLDLGLPDCFGAKTLKTISSYSPMTPIVVLTGAVMPREEIRYCLDSSCSFIVKGYQSSQTLVGGILSAIEKQDARKRLSTHFVKN